LFLLLNKTLAVNFDRLHEFLHFFPHFVKQT